MKVPINHLLIEREPLEYKIDSLILSDFVMTSKRTFQKQNIKNIFFALASQLPCLPVASTWGFRLKASEDPSVLTMQHSTSYGPEVSLNILYH